MKTCQKPEQSDVSYIFRVKTATTQRNTFVPFSLHFIRQLSCHFCNDEARSNGIGTDTARTQFLCDRLSQTNHTSLRSWIVALSCITVYTYYWSHVDDASLFLTHHNRCTCMDEVEGRFQVDCNHSIPLSFAHTHHQTVFCNTCIVHQDINRTKVFVNLFYHLCSIFKACCIWSVSFYFYAISRNFLFCILAFSSITKSVKAMFAPSAANFNAMALPIPRAAPVTIAVFSS